MAERSGDVVYVYKTSLCSPHLTTFHARGELTTQTKRTRCGRLAATWLPGQPQLHRVAEVHVLHAKAFAVPCSTCYPDAVTR